MSTPMMLAIVVAATGAVAVPIPGAAAELPPPAVAHVRHHHGVPCCTFCGCRHVSYIHHRELRTTYGLSFDPRNFDQTEPYYYFGPVRAYPRYWVDANPVR